jgi:multiple sugar transport system ATP-binding protein
LQVSLHGVEKRWGAFTAIPGLDLTIEDKEFLVLLGPSGCGKTTTMRMIAGLEAVSAGEIRIGGVPVNDRPARDRDIAMVLQNYGLYPHMTVGENIAYPLKLRKVPSSERRTRVEAAAAKVQLETLLDRKPRQLSGGQRQRVALARAIVRRPNIFLMDEPLSNLDAVLRVSMRAELKRLHHELETTTVYVTHDQIEAMTLASRVAVMNKGAIVQLGTPEEIHDDPASIFVATFIGSPPMNMMRGRVQDGVFEAPGLRLPVGVGASAPEAVLGIRPDAVSVTAPEKGDARGTVYSAEYTGSHTQATVRLGESRLTALAPTSYRPGFDEIVGLAFDASRLFVFDGRTEERLR